MTLVKKRPFGNRRLTAAAAVSLLAPSVLFGQDVLPPSKAARAPEIRLSGDTVALPIVVVREYPFIEGSVAGVTGKFMLDTGAEQALAINDHRVPLAGGKAIGSGHFGSGQTFAVRLMPEVPDIHVADLTFRRATTVQAQDARQLEGITPDFLGWFGYTAWAGYSMKLDYQRKRVTFYKHGPEDYLKGETIIATLPFEVRKLPNHPLMSGRIGRMPIVAAWDTGQYGTLFASASSKRRLLQDKSLRLSNQKTGGFDLSEVRIGSHYLPGVRAIDVETGGYAAAAPIGISESNVLTIGYGFLRQYKTVWDYTRHRIYLLKP